MTKNKTFKTCMITQQTDYLTEEQIKAVLNSKKTIKDYCYILHDKDKDENGNLKASHYHIVLRFTGSIDIKYICEWFNVKEQYIEPIKTTFMNSLQYLIHKNNPEKYQYDIKECKTNNIKLIKQIEQPINLTISEILELINIGVIRKWNYTKYINLEQVIKYKKQIDIAFRYWEDEKEMNPNRNIKVIFITGESGKGKSTYSKYLANERTNGGGVCVGSSSNDPLQDYKNQESLILDDLRDNSFTFTDFLKVLDNHTNSSIKSRFNNKRFYGSLIIITSKEPITKWYSNIKNPEDRKQLYRRINEYYIIEDDLLIKGFIDEYGNVNNLTPELFDLDYYKNYCNQNKI